MNTGTNQRGTSQTGHIQAAFSRQNNHQNLLVSNVVPPNPTKSELKNKTPFALPPLLPLAPVKSICVHPRKSVVPISAKIKNYQTNPFRNFRFRPQTKSIPHFHVKPHQKTNPFCRDSSRGMRRNYLSFRADVPPCKTSDFGPGTSDFPATLDPLPLTATLEINQ